VLQVQPWNWLFPIPGARFLLGPINQVTDQLVRWSNAQFFHVRETLVLPNGSGDTSWSWAEMWLYLSIATVATIVWSLLDRKRERYERAAFWLRMIVRYYIAFACISYGIIKIFALQMPFPGLSQLATPLGDLLPMRFSWLFLGYSFPYQAFSGTMEFVAGVLLMYRRTVTAGLLLAAGAFANVFMINLSYDVPVKLFSGHLLFASIFLLALDSKRLFKFFVLNRAAGPTHAYDLNFTNPLARFLAFVVKALILFQFVWTPTRSSWTRYQASKLPPSNIPFHVGVYDVKQFTLNGDSTSSQFADSLRWKDVIFDNAGSGSVNTSDTVFWRRYGRGYFRYRADTAARTVAVWKTSTIPRDSTFLFTMRYEIPDSSSIRLFAPIRGDTVRVDLVRSARYFQLAERQFHWISEYNR
jgi:hypothetical protein